MPPTPDLSGPSDALAASLATRELVRSLPPSDATRRQALQGSLDALKATWTAEHESYCRRGPQSEKRTYRQDDPVRVLARERRDEMGRIRKMLNPSSGTSRPRAPIFTSPAVMRGHIGKTTEVLLHIDTAHEDAKRRHRHGSITATKGGGYFMSMRELHEEARRLLDMLGRERARLRTEWGRYALTGDGRVWDEFNDRVELLRMKMDALAAELRRSLQKRVPDERVEDPTWTRDRILRALSRHVQEHGDLPSARQCNRDHRLPAYTVMTRKLGPSPLAEARRLLRLPGAASALAS